MNRTSRNGQLLTAEESWPSNRFTAAQAEATAAVHPDEILAQLRCMLADDLFVRSERLSRFLRFIVDQALRGQAHHLNQYSVGLAAFDKPPSFDPNIDPIVRVEAGRLRAKLREYYATSGQADPVRIGMAKSGYRPIFKRWPPEAASSRTVIQAGQNGVVERETGPVFDRERPVRPVNQKIAVAVLPFSNLSRDAASDQFCREISGHMSEQLARLTSRAVHVVNPVVDAGGSSPEIGEIGRRYNAEVVLEGSLQTVRSHIRIFSMLARTADASGIWAHSYDGSFEDLCSQQSKTLLDIAEDVAEALQLEEARKPVAV